MKKIIATFVVGSLIVIISSLGVFSYDYNTESIFSMPTAGKIQREIGLKSDQAAEKAALEEAAKKEAAAIQQAAAQQAAANQAAANAAAQAAAQQAAANQAAANAAAQAAAQQAAQANNPPPEIKVTPHTSTRTS